MPARPSFPWLVEGFFCTVRFRRNTPWFYQLGKLNFILIANENVDTGKLSPCTLSVLRDAGGPIAAIVAKIGASDEQIADIQGQFLSYMKEHEINAMLVGPDFYLFEAVKDIAGTEKLIE